MMNRIQNVLMPGVDNSKYAMPTGVVNLNVTKDAHLTLVVRRRTGSMAQCHRLLLL